MSDWDDFLTFDNFQLAWKRILRSNHRYNKDWIGLDVYGANLTTNLNHLRDKLRENVYNPSHAEKMYMPKRSGALRSFPFLYIEDRLVYQAIANVIATKTKEHFEVITRGRVFAHLAADNLKSEFMLKKWDGQHGQYKHFLNRFHELLQRGYSWVMEADIASFYDSIDHDLLVKNLSSYLIEDKLIEFLKKCLHTWSKHKDEHELSRGLPQGYEASDYLSTIFLLPVDKNLIDHSAHYHYIRYVDDFRVLSDNRDLAEQAMVELDVSLKSQALILQGAKTDIRELTDTNDEINRIARKISIMQNMDSRQNMSQNESILMFLRAWRSIKENNQDENAESRMIFAMNRMPADYLVRDFVLDMLKNMYHRSMDITKYLSNFKGDRHVIEALLDEIRDHKAYTWHIANCIIALSEISEDYEYRYICHNWISDQRIHWYLRLVAVQSLKNDPESYSFLFLRYQKEPNYLVRRMILLITTHIAYTNEQKAAMIRIGMKDPNPQIVATAVHLYLRYPECGINENEFTDIKTHNKMIHAFSGVDSQQACYIRENLTSLFNVKVPFKLEYRAIFNTSYDAAVKSLFYAVAYYYTDPNLFVTALDDLNHIIAIAINEEIESENIPRDKYENLLNKLETLKPKYDDITIHFRKCHDFRCKNPLAHPWAKSTGDWSKDITHPEKDELIKRLCISYQEFTNIFATKFGIT